MSRRMHASGHPRLARVFKSVNFLLFKTILPPEADVAPTVKLQHMALGVVIHPNVAIGPYTEIYQGVTLAASSPTGSEVSIRVGSRVSIGASAVIVASPNRTVTIGDGAVIGANSTVTRDVAAHTVVAGSPARVVGRSGEIPG